MKYQLEHHPNPQCLTIHVNKQLTTKSIESSEYTLDNEKSPLIQAVLEKAPEVVSLSIKKYKLSLVKGVLFKWEEIVPNALSVLRERFDPENEMQEASSPIRERGRMGIFMGMGMDMMGDDFPMPEPADDEDLPDVEDQADVDSEAPSPSEPTDTGTEDAT